MSHGAHGVAHTRQLARELGPRGILVNCFEAGVTDTPAMRLIPGSEVIKAEALRRNPGGRLTTPEDIAATFVALMDPRIRWISGTTVRVDGGEIQEHRWMQAVDALAAQRVGEIELPPPTFVTLTGLASYRSAAAALRAVRAQPFATFLPRLHITPDGACTLYGEDAGYESGDLDRPGPRHRLSMRGSAWVYERVLG